MTDGERRDPIALTTLYTTAMFAVAAFVAFVVITYGVTHGDEFGRTG